MKIPKLFKKAAAFVMAAVTALSIMPATAFAAGDIGTISFSHTYDSNGNAMRYNSSANIGGYTAGGTGNYKYRMFVDGENAFCIQPGVPLKTGNTLKKASSDTWNALSANQKKAVGLALLYGYQGNRNNLSGSDDEKWLATQTLVWEFVTGCREATGSYNQTSTTVYSLHFGSNYANSGARAVYDQIVAMLREHNTIPSFMSGGKNDITKELAYKDGKYSITLTDSNGVLSDYSFSSSDSNVSVSKSGNMLNFGKLYDIISDEEKKNLITYLIKEIQIYPNGESEMPLKSIEFNFPIYRDGQEVRRLLWEKGNTVETRARSRPNRCPRRCAPHLPTPAAGLPRALAPCGAPGAGSAATASAHAAAHKAAA